MRKTLTIKTRVISLIVMTCASLFAPAKSPALDLSSTNRDCLNHFWRAVNQKESPLSIVSFGDSMADSYRSIAFVLMNRFRESLGTAGYSLNNYENSLMCNLTNGASIVEPDQFWFTRHFMIPPTGSTWWEKLWSPGGILSDTVGIFYVAHPEGGHLDLLVSTNGGPWSKVLTLDAYSATSTGCFTNVELSLNFHRLRVDGRTGNNHVIGPSLLNSRTNGIHAVFIEQAGIDLGQVTNVPASIRVPVFRALGPDLVIWHMKERPGEDLRQRLIDCEQWWTQAIPRADVVYIGTPWIGADSVADHTLAQNTLVRSTALAHGRAYVDCMTPAISFEWMSAKGFMADETHPNLAGNTYLAQKAWDDLQFPLLRSPRWLSIEQFEGGVQISHPTFPKLLHTLERSENSLDWSPVYSRQGNGLPFSTNFPATTPQRVFRLRTEPDADQSSP